jgi:Flp pilus assembly pilin Flp
MLNSLVKDFVREEDGQDLVEYSLLMAFIALGLVATMGTVKNTLNTLWNRINTKIGTISNSAT